MKEILISIVDLVKMRFPWIALLLIIGVFGVNKTEILAFGHEAVKECLK